MSVFRFAYIAEFLLALIAVFVLWSEVGGQSHLDLMPWYLKLVLGGGAAFATVKATSAAVSQDRGWNSQTLRWVGILLVLLVGCGLATYYVHVYGEEDEDQEDESLTSSLIVPFPRVTLVDNAQAWFAAGSGFVPDSWVSVGIRRASPRRANGARPADPGCGGPCAGHAGAGRDHRFHGQLGRSGAARP